MKEKRQVFPTELEFNPFLVPSPEGQDPGLVSKQPSVERDKQHLHVEETWGDHWNPVVTMSNPCKKSCHYHRFPGRT